MIDVEALRHFLVVFGISTVRMLAAIAVTPFMSTQLVQGRIRNSIVISWALIVYPIVSPTVPDELGSTVFLFAVVVKEIVLGMLLGFFASKIFWTAISVGYFIDNQRGATLAAVFDPNSGEQTSPFGILLQNTLICVFFASGGFLLFLGGLLESYAAWPVFGFFPQLPDSFPGLILGEVDNFMVSVVVLAAPVIIAVFLAEFGLGLVNRFAPQLNVFILSLPVKSLVACIVLLLYIPFLMEGLAANLGDADDLFRYLKGDEP